MFIIFEDIVLIDSDRYRCIFRSTTIFFKIIIISTPYLFSTTSYQFYFRENKWKWKWFGVLFSSLQPHSDVTPVEGPGRHPAGLMAPCPPPPNMWGRQWPTDACPVRRQIFVPLHNPLGGAAVILYPSGLKCNLTLCLKLIIFSIFLT